MQCLFCFALTRFPASPAPQQIQYLPQRSSPDLLWNLALLWWTQQDVSPNILQTSVFSRLLNTWFGMHLPPHPYGNSAYPCDGMKDLLISLLSRVLKCIIPSELMAMCQKQQELRRYCSQWARTEPSHNLCAVCNYWPVLQPPFSILKGFDWYNCSQLWLADKFRFM